MTTSENKRRFRENLRIIIRQAGLGLLILMLIVYYGMMAVYLQM